METIRPQSEMFQRNPEAHGAASTAFEFPRELLKQLSPQDIAWALHKDALEGESYEAAAESLGSIDELIGFRKRIAKLPFSSFYEIAEAITNIERLPIAPEERMKQRATALAMARERVQRMSPRVADLYQAMLAEIEGVPYEPSTKEAREKIADLKKVEDQRSDLDILFSGDTSWDLKANRIEKQLVRVLKGFRSLDEIDGNTMDDDLRKWRRGEIEKMPTTPPDDSDESEPRVDPRERRKEDEPAFAIWSIQSAYKNYDQYFREKAFSRWDSARNKWVGEYQYTDARHIPLSGMRDSNVGPIDLISSTMMRAGTRVRVPVSYTHSFSKAEVAGGRAFRVEQNQDGDTSIFVDGSGEVEVKMYLAPHPEKKFTSDPAKVRTPEMPAEFSEETNKRLEDIKSKKRGNIARAKAIASYVRQRIKYLAPKDKTESDQYNAMYRTHAKGFAGAVDECRKGDCDVVNTYFSALCATLDIPTRHIVGHSADQDNEDNLVIHFGTGHAWSEVWDEREKEWVKVDATPPGDPNLESEPGDKKGRKHTPNPGEQEAITPSAEKLEELRKKLAEKKTQLSYTKEERRLAEGAGIELKEARQIVGEINAAERTRLPNGELITDALAQLFNAIEESRKTRAAVYDGPVRKKEGGEAIQDIVRHSIGMRAGEIDPISREKPMEEVRQEGVFGGFDVYMIGDKSGSMGSVSGSEHLWEMQRRAEYLIFSALYRFEKNIKRAGFQKENALTVRTEGISFRGDGKDDIDLDKPLSPAFNAQDKVSMWHSLTEQGSGNGDVAALSYIYEQIKAEIEENERRGIKEKRLRIVIACSDGGPDSAEGVQMMAEKLGKLGVVVVGIGLTETAAAVPIIYETPYSRGDIARDINDLPAVVAKHIVLEAIKLFPEKAKANARLIIESSIAKFPKHA